MFCAMATSLSCRAYRSGPRGPSPFRPRRRAQFRLWMRRYPIGREMTMTDAIGRRAFLKASAAFAGAAAAGGFGCVEIASAAPIQVPTIDKLTMRVLIDQAHDQFLRGSAINGVVHEGPGPGRSA